MTKRYPAGSEWRKWDLHVHVPGTKLSDAYDKSDGHPDFDRFAEILEASDVSVFGITDYFSVGQTLAFIKHFKKKYPNSEKLLLVNVELRLNETVNRDQQMVDFHVIFRDSVTDVEMNEFLSRLPTQLTVAHGRAKTCSELTGNDYNTATVTRADIKKAFRETFGEKAEPTEFLIYLAPANNNGLRAQSGKQRKANLADEIDKDVHAVFGKDPDNSAHFLTSERFEDKTQLSKPKPVFGGCDAHSFTDLGKWLGAAIDEKSTRQVVTWVKADPTFEGLQQTLVEPGDRVSISELMPHAKDQYKVIKRVRFEGSTDFPTEIVFNSGLNAIIGSRSSGKSALLAHIAHAVDAEYTVAQQKLATKLKESEIGPAAGRSWKSVESTICKVEWADGSTEGGQVIYIPQNWLYQISDNPKEVTGKIRPVLESHYSAYFRDQQRLLDSVKSANEAVDKAVARWFDLAEVHAKLDTEIKQVGEKKSITRARDDIKAQIEVLRAANSLSAEDLEKYQAVVNDLEVKRSRIDEIGIEVEQLEAFVVEESPKKFSPALDAVSVETYLTPDPSDLSESLAEALNLIIAASHDALVPTVEAAIVSHRAQLAIEVEKLVAAIAKLETDNKDLLEKHKANATLDELVKRQKAQQDSFDKIEKLEARRVIVVQDQKGSIEQIEKQSKSRAEALESLSSSFGKEDRVLDQLTFGIALGHDPAVIKALSDPFRKNETGTFLTKEGDSDVVVDVDKAQDSPADFLRDLFTKKQKLNQGNLPVDIARRVLTATQEIRFTATLDGDRIGGFDRSTMTPGKQALFALTLILGEAEDRWALLIDQPEDDLDSRSIYRDIVRYLVEQKKQRQIILVTHNANLVVGADAEEVLVANRHGDDRKNKDGRTFDYLTGSLEHSEQRKSATYELDRMGIREHSVEILDGGEEAFQKRRDKYKI
jgi:hypothetical protein